MWQLLEPDLGLAASITPSHARSYCIVACAGRKSKRTYQAETRSSGDVGGRFLGLSRRLVHSLETLCLLLIPPVPTRLQSCFHARNGSFPGHVRAVNCTCWNHARLLIPPQRLLPPFRSDLSRRLTLRLACATMLFFLRRRDFLRDLYASEVSTSCCFHTS